MPVTVTGGVIVSDRAKEADPAAAQGSVGFRTVLYPSLRLSSNWFVASTVQVRSTPFFYYEAFYPKRAVKLRFSGCFSDIPGREKTARSD